MKFFIGSKLILSFFSILFFVSLAGVYSISITRNILRDTMGQRTVFLAEDALGDIDKDIFLKIEGIQLYTKDELLQNIIEESNLAFEKLENRDAYIAQADREWRSVPQDETTPFMKDLIENKISDTLRREFIGFWEKKYGSRVYGEAFVTNKFGVNVSQTGKTTDYYQADEAWWQKAKDTGFYVGEIEYDESAAAWTMPLAVKIEDAEGNFLGVIKAIPLAREMIRAVESTTKRYETAEMSLLTKEGLLIYKSRPYKMLEDVSRQELFKRIESQNGFFIGNDDGREKLFAHAHSKGFRDFLGLGWILVIGSDSAEVFSLVGDLQKALVASTSVVSLFVLALAFFLARTISRPIRKLMDAANSIASGNLDIRIPMTSQDELGQLASSFNMMAEKLRQSHEGLERNVKERTQELQDRVGQLDKTAKLLVRRDFELLQANETLREMDEAKSRFVSIAAHQLRTPLAGIKWTVQMLLSGDFGKITNDQKEALKNALVTLERLAKLIGDLLNVARIEGGKFKFVFSSVHIEEVARKVFDESIAEAKNRGISINFNIPEEGFPRVRGDFENLAIALRNIVDNAITYTSKGGVITLIVMKDPRNPKRVRVSVQDTGIGIPDEQKSLVGQKFFRADNAVRDQIPGTGLGLYIVKRILEQHEGALEIESQEERGSAVSFTLPFVEGE